MRLMLKEKESFIHSNTLFKLILNKNKIVDTIYQNYKIRKLRILFEKSQII